MDKPPGRSKSPNLTGCGPSKSMTPHITLNISTTTGGNFAVAVNSQNCVDTLKKIISKKLKVAKDRICLLHRERELQEGTLKANGLQEGSKILLIPNVETGLLAQRPENTVMQALESLNDSQVNDFLSGKTPLNLSMRLGDHMMLIQLQLSTVNPSSSPHSITKPRSSHRKSNERLVINQPSTTATENTDSDKNNHKISVEMDNLLAARLSASADVCSSSSLQRSNSPTYKGTNINSLLAKQNFENLHNIVKNITMVQNPSVFADTTVSTTQLTDINEPEKRSLCGSVATTSSLLTSNISDAIKNNTVLEQSPIKSLSNLVSTSIRATSIKQISKNHNFSKSVNAGGSNDYTDPILANLTSCLCKQLNPSDTAQRCEYNNCRTCYSTEIESSEKNQNATNDNSYSVLHKTANNPIEKSKHRCYQHYYNSNIIRKYPNNVTECKKHVVHENLKSATCINNSNIFNITSKKEEEIKMGSIEDQQIATVNGERRTLAEASRNLTQTLRKLSKEVFTNKMEFNEERSRKNASGPVIESMKNHGKGIYSGTFSGTLNPALQDRYGRPKRDISTVIHILNDLLSATPHYSRGTKISFHTPSPSRSSKQISVRNQSTSTTEVCGSCFNSSKSETCTYGECQGHNQNETNAEIIVCHKKRTECQSPTSLSICYKDLCSKSSNNHTSEGNIVNILNNTPSVNDKSYGTCGEVASVDATKAIETPIPNQSICNKCTIELENNKTKYKVEQLKVVMQQRKQKREARKLKNSPYGIRIASNTLTTNVSQVTSNAITSLASPNDVSSKHVVEEVDTAV